jgi:hypothetical protein
MSGCPGTVRHQFTVRGHPGLRSPVCGSCGAPNPRRLSGPEWAELVAAYQDDRGMASRALARAIGARRAEQRVAARKIRDILQEIDEQRTR